MASEPLAARCTVEQVAAVVGRSPEHKHGAVYSAEVRQMDRVKQARDRRRYLLRDATKLAIWKRPIVAKFAATSLETSDAADVYSRLAIQRAGAVSFGYFAFIRWSQVQILPRETV
jgi:hypothetical protein